MFGFYGIGTISEGASSQSGGLFLVISLLFLYQSSIHVKNKLKLYFLFCSIISMFLTLATVSRTAISAMLIVLIIYILYKLLFSKLNLIYTFTSMVVVATCSLLVFKYFTPILEYVERRLVSGFDSGANTRQNKWDRLLSESDNIGLVFGNGKGFTQTLTGGFTLSADSQFVRLILEVGYIGLVLWFIPIILLITFALVHLKRYTSESLSIILLILAFLIMSVTHEVFLVTIQASIFWIMISLFIGIILNKKNSSSNSHEIV
ncbi:hypothetical protein [Texcoconibacillus texcoconensis]|uniref:O-antigen ligase domain-containing protein n=1 Tax=Texcoconibacillus texcoconensis TaxID=1095777 RepID=A0A840QTC8_9BACI|nr:hypothetical protein [Texcoconibacillus texcoconensis]MBB5174559.1 hypothetical protein [Texcoconibacillus texcoconensis]